MTVFKVGDRVRLVGTLGDLVGTITVMPEGESTYAKLDVDGESWSWPLGTVELEAPQFKKGDRVKWLEANSLPSAGTVVDTMDGTLVEIQREVEIQRDGEVSEPYFVDPSDLTIINEPVQGTGRKIGDALFHGEATFTPSETGGVKGDKPVQMSLIPVEALAEVAALYAQSQAKYPPINGKANWAHGYNWRLSYDAAQRHLMRFWYGEDTDPESGLSPLAHAAFHLNTLMAFQARGIGTDDRPASR